MVNVHYCVNSPPFGEWLTRSERKRPVFNSLVPHVTLPNTSHVEVRAGDSTYPGGKAVSRSPRTSVSEPSLNNWCGAAVSARTSSLTFSLLGGRPSSRRPDLRSTCLVGRALNAAAQ